MRRAIALALFCVTPTAAQANSGTTVSDWLKAGYEIKAITATGGGGFSKGYVVYFQNGAKFARCRSDRRNNIIDCYASE